MRGAEITWFTAVCSELMRARGACGCRSAVADRQPLNPVQPARSQPLRVPRPADGRHRVRDRVEYQVDLEPGEVRSHAVVRAGTAETQVRIRAAGDVEALGLVEDLLVEVGRLVKKAAPVA